MRELDQARDPRSSSAALRGLSGHPDRAVREAVAANPATPRDAIAALLDGLEGVEPGERQALAAAVLSNPSLDLWLLDEPAWPEQLPPEACLELARSPALTALTWSALSQLDDERSRGPLLASPAAPPDAWQRLDYASELDALLDRASHLAHRPDAMAATLAALVQHPEFPDALERQPDWLDDQPLAARRWLACSPGLTRALWRALARESYRALYESRLLLLGSPAAPPDAWEQLDLPDGGELLLNHEHLDAESIAALAAAPPLATITALNLSSNEGVGDDGAVALLRSPFVGGLTSLGLSQTGLGPRGLEALVQATTLRGLERLDIGGNGLGEVDPEAVARLARFDGLVSLDLSSNGLRDEHVAALIRAGGLASLAELHLMHNQLTGACLADMGEWLPRGSLASLWLSFNQLDAAALDALVRPAIPSPLTSLHLGHNRLTASSASALARLSVAFPRLDHLDLWNSELDDGCASELARSAFPRLTRLSLGCNERLGDEGVSALARATAMGQLQELSAIGTGVGDAGLEALARSSAFPELKVLALAYTRVSDRGVRALVRSTNTPRLEWLSLVSCREITDESVHALIGAPFFSRLTYLGLDSCPGVSREAYRALSEAAARVPGLRLR